MGYGNIMNSDCEGCFFKLGHRCDLTEHECRNQQHYIPEPAQLKTANKLNDYCKECNYRKDDKCEANLLCINNSLFTVGGDVNEKQCIKCKHSCESIYSCKDCIDFSDYDPINPINPIKEEDKMNYEEAYKELKESFALCTKELNDLKKEIEELKQKNSSGTEEADEPVLEDYETAFMFHHDTGGFYYLNSNGEITSATFAGFVYRPTDYNPWCNYLSKEYADTSAKIRRFNDMLLAFKWCYDRDYIPKYSDSICEDAKWYVYYDTEEEQYLRDSLYAWVEPTVYFSSEEIAEKCCNWLNDIDPDGQFLR